MMSHHSDIQKSLSELKSNLVYKKEIVTKNTYLEHNFLPPALAECACKNGYNRSQYAFREKIEEQIIQEIEKRFPSEKTKKLNYLSLGSGYLLQDFILCSKLILKGYSLNINLIEPDKDLVGFQEALSQFKQLQAMASERKTSITINCFSNIMDYIKKSADNVDNKVHVAHAIDFASVDDLSTLNMYEDVLLTHQMLRDDGFLHVSLGGRTCLFNKSELIEFKDHGFLSALPTNMPLLAVLSAFDEQVKHVIPTNQKVQRVEEAIAESITSAPQHVVKNMLLYTGIFRQGPLFENEKKMLEAIQGFKNT